MSVWYCIPSKRPPEEAEKCLKLWKERGYMVSIQRDRGDVGPNAFPSADAITYTEYRGYAQAVNDLVRRAIDLHDAEWLVTGGDDIEPDANHSAEEIARECSEYFWHYFDAEHRLPTLTIEQATTFGVMQPTGDRFADGSIDRICGSPWMGREFCRRMYQGNGPLWPEYTRFFMDEELQAVTVKLGVLWQRPDLIHLHNWYARADRSLTSGTKATPMPAHLREQESRWTPEKEIFRARRATGFPGHEPLEA